MMTEAEILQAVEIMIECLPETLESVIEYIQNSEEFCIFKETLNNLREPLPDKEAVLEKIRETLQEIVERKPPSVELEFTLKLPAPEFQAELTVVPPLGVAGSPKK